jgi:hypothetical protein
MAVQNPGFFEQLCKPIGTVDLIIVSIEGLMALIALRLDSMGVASKILY